MKESKYPTKSTTFLDKFQKPITIQAYAFRDGRELWQALQLQVHPSQLFQQLLCILATIISSKEFPCLRSKISHIYGCVLRIVLRCVLIGFLLTTICKNSYDNVMKVKIIRQKYKCIIRGMQFAKNVDKQNKRLKEKYSLMASS